MSKLQQALQSQTQKKPTTVIDLMQQHKAQIALALPKHMNADRMLRIVTTELRKTPALGQCDPISLFGAVIQAAQLGLEPNASLGHCYLLPFNKKGSSTPDVQLIIGYKGMIDLARRSGQIISLSARAVYANDEFSYEYGLDEKLHHKPCVNEDKGALIFVYAVAKLKDGGVQFEVMSKADIDGIRKQSKSGGSAYSPWATHYDEMAKKSVVRRLFKYLPISIELQTAVTVDENGDAGKLSYDNAIDIGQQTVETTDEVTEVTNADDDIIVSPEILAKAAAFTETNNTTA